MDYLIPAATDMPPFTVLQQDYPSTGNPEGFKGLAEGGTIPPMAAVLAAVEDAFYPKRPRLHTIPLRPETLMVPAGPTDAGS